MAGKLSHVTGPVVGWTCLILACLLALAPVPLLLLWLIPAMVAVLAGIAALARQRALHGAMLLTGVLLWLPLSWLLGMSWMLGATQRWLGGA